MNAAEQSVSQILKLMPRPTQEEYQLLLSFRSLFW